MSSGLAVPGAVGTASGIDGRPAGLDLAIFLL
jgi:hypothetical protein